MTTNKLYSVMNGSPATGWYVWEVQETGHTQVRDCFKDLYVLGADDEYLYIQCWHFFTEEDALKHYNDRDYSDLFDKVLIP